LKRSEYLYPLSWQHHDLLMAVLLVKKGIRNNTSPELLSSFIIHVWDTILSKHIQMEEDAFYFSVGHPTLGDYFQRVTEEHQQLRSILRNLQEDKSIESITAFNEMLEQHIRFEERVFFPALQEHVTKEKMNAMGQALGQIEKQSCLNYPVRFWE